MRITITVIETDQLLNIELPDDFALPDFQSYIESETNIAPEIQELLYEGKILDLKAHSTLGELKLDDDSLLVLQKRQPAQIPSSSSGQTGQYDSEAERVRQELLANPELLATIPESPLKASINDKTRFKEIFDQVFPGPGVGANWSVEDEQKPENQEKIMEIINRKAIEENMATAYELSPESFTKIHMLYINVYIEHVHIKAFVDTGAESTILHPEIAEKCGLSRLIDKRFVGQAIGVGSTEILGRIHSAPLKIGTQFFPCGFTVLDAGVDMLLGLDMLRRYQACVDLKRNMLVIDNVEAPFLPETECPRNRMHPAVKDSPVTGAPGTVVPPPAEGASGSSTKRPRLATPRNTATSSSTPACTTNSTAPVIADPAKVEQLIGLGFTRQQAELALKQTNNNVELAAGMLFGL
ncbi:unnamed protein product [Ambrosiozyma monospora]|uniref:Unnamed protein product n=1 Tax=Ambrosiozyma monospora TaxID=43982 RepID=A0ACB5TE05_AMBMO|nr:unnamed protein product [Ambrosiozyma monospora]